MAQDNDNATARLERQAVNAKGKFTGFGSADDIEQAKGRFSEIMPQKPQTEENRKMARQLLMMMSVVPEEMGFNPMWN